MDKVGWNEIVAMATMESAKAVGHFVRNIKKPTNRQWTSTILGVVGGLIICSWGFLHLLILTVGNALILLHVDKRYIHIASLVFSYTHLTIYHLEHYTWIPVSPVYLFNLFNYYMMRMVNLALDVQEAHKLNDKGQLDERSKVYINLTFTEICHFAFSYQGTINIFRYRTYYDWVHCPLGFDRACRVASRSVLARAIRRGLIIAPIVLMFPPQEMKSEEFYQEKLFVHRILHFIVVSFALRMAMYSAVTNGDMICTMSGLGAYPTKTKPMVGAGPTVQLELLDELAKDPDQAKQEELSFETVNCVDAYKAEMMPTLRAYWRDYNRGLRYYHITNLYRRFPIKSLRMFTVFLMSAWCHRFEGGFFFSLLYTALYVPVEDLWDTLYKKHATGTSAKICNLLFWLSRLLALTFITIASYLETFELVIRYLNSVYYFHLIYPVIMYAIGMLILSRRIRLRAVNIE